MKRNIWMIWMLVICLLAGCSCALAAEEKTEGDSCLFLEKEYIVFSQNAYSKNTEFSTAVDISHGGEYESATEVTISFLSGEKAMKGLFGWKKSSPESVTINTPPKGTEGEATFHVRVETEHYYKEKDITVKAMIFDQTVDTTPILIRAKVGERVNLSRKIQERDPYQGKVGAVTGWWTENGAGQTDYDTDGMNFTARKEGEYRLSGFMFLGDAGVNIEIPIVVCTGETVSDETARWLKKKGYTEDPNAGNAGKADGQADAAETGSKTSDGPDQAQQTAGEPYDMKDLAGYWKTAEFLADGKKVAEKDEVALSMYLNISGRGYLVLKQAQMTVGMLLSWKTTDSGMELIPDSGQNQIALTRNDDGSMSLRVDELAITIVQQNWKIESMAKKTEKPENLTGRWVDMGTEIENVGVLPQELIEFSGAQNPEHLIYINETGFVSYFLKKDGQTSIRMLNLEEEEGQLVAKEMLYTDSGTPDYATYPVSIYENGWLEISLYGQRKFFARDDFWGISISAKDEPKTVTAGKSVTFTAEFEQPEKVKEIDGNVYWSVTRQDGGELGDIASIDKKGVLKISRDLQEKVVLVVKGKSGGNTSDTYTIEAVPALKKLTIEPDKAVMYLGETEPLTVRVIAEPADAMPEKLDWKVNGKAAELEADGAQSMRIKAVQAGKATVQVKDAAGGKTAKLTVNVLEPVTAVEISGPETVKAGKTASYKAVLEPKKPGDKTVIWSVDADESIATVNKNGQVKVSKNAPSGTVITLTAQAQGSPKEVKDTFQITVE